MTFNNIKYYLFALFTLFACQKEQKDTLAKDSTVVKKEFQDSLNNQLNYFNAVNINPSFIDSYGIDFPFDKQQTSCYKLQKSQMALFDINVDGLCLASSKNTFVGGTSLLGIACQLGASMTNIYFYFFDKGNKKPKKLVNISYSRNVKCLDTV